MSTVGIGVSCLVPGAGAGQRLGLGPKAFLELRGRPLLRWIADKALQVADEVLVAVPPGLVDEATAMLPECRVIVGGATRQDSIALLARQARGEWLIVHDAARPFASMALLQSVLDTARRTGCAGAFLDPDVPVARLRDGRVVEAYAHDEVGVFQSPQAFSRANMQAMLARQADAPGWYGQSTIQLALLAGVAVHAVPGEKTNIKITTTEDWQRARQQGDLLT
jgi:2-C-methyl-D-erythritol 4-phosphate cytidylyltransferase